MAINLRKVIEIIKSRLVPPPPDAIHFLQPNIKLFGFPVELDVRASENTIVLHPKIMQKIEEQAVVKRVEKTCQPKN